MEPKKSLGQNFLLDKNIAKKILMQISIKNKNVIEIGPGYGSLTDLIIKEFPKNLFILEKDYKISNYLEKKYKKINNIKILNEDALKVNFNFFNKAIVISNLPYNVSSKIILKLFKYKYCISEVVVMIQKEVGLKFDFTINPVNKYNFLTLLCAKYKRCFNVSKNVFYPKPKVESSVVKFIFNKREIDWDKTNNFVNKIFSNKRKKIYKKIHIKNTKLKKILEKRIDEINSSEVLKIYNSF